MSSSRCDTKGQQLSHGFTMAEGSFESWNQSTHRWSMGRCKFSSTGASLPFADFVSQILSRNHDAKFEMEDLIQAITIAHEPPTLADLAVLTGIDDVQLLSDLVQQCAPILRVERSGENINKVTFSHDEFASHLKIKAHGHEGHNNSQKQQYNGMIAIRCFHYIKELYRSQPGGLFPADTSTSLRRSATITTRTSSDAGVLMVSNEDEEVDDHDSGSSASSHDCLYPIKYLVYHLSEAFSNVVDDLFEDEPNFWSGESPVREAWLRDFQIVTSELKGLETRGMSTIHVAAGIEAVDLVSVLVSKCGKESLAWTSDDGLTPVSII